MLSHLLVLAVLSLRSLSSTAQNYSQFLQKHQRENGLAPLYGTEFVYVNPNEYGVMRWPGYTLEQHYLIIGKNLSETVGFVDIGFGYLATLDDDVLLSSIRADPGVLFVQTNRALEIVPCEESYEKDELNDDFLAMYGEND